METFQRRAQRELAELHRQRRWQRTIFSVHLGTFAFATCLIFTGFYNAFACFWVLWVGAFMLHLLVFIGAEIRLRAQKRNLNPFVAHNASQAGAEASHLTTAVRYAIGDDGELVELDDEPLQKRKRE